MIRINGSYGGQLVNITIALENSAAELEAFKQDMIDAPVVVSAIMDALVPVVKVCVDKFPAIAEALVSTVEHKLPWYITWHTAIAARLEKLSKAFFKI